MPSGSAPRVSVLMPTHGQAAFIRRAIDSLLAQTFVDWELRIVDDASPDDTAERLRDLLEDPRLHLRRLARNVGVGAALNIALDDAEGGLISYLPSDDVLQADHLQTLVETLEGTPQAVLAYAGLRHHYNRTSVVPLADDGLQLVQLMHRAVPGFRWRDRSELVTDDLERMGLDRLHQDGAFVPTGTVTCEWVDHPGQLHKLIREPVGGIAPYRRRYRVEHPLIFQSSVGDRIDEVTRYARHRSRPDTPAAADGLRILLAGELAYNADRVLALEERGHRLFGLWMSDPYWYNTVGPLPFGHVVDATSDDPAAAMRETRPDVVYALLNWQAIPFAARVMRASRGVPFVWHFKEGPFIALEKGMWSELVDLTEHADGLIYSSEEMRSWFGTTVPGSDDPARTLVLDGDLPKADWLDAPLGTRLSDDDGEIHTVVPGRPIGLHPEDVAELASLGVHLHFYGNFTHGQWRAWIERTRRLASRHLHLHPTVGPEGWVNELSRYDAGWLHVFRSRNHGDVRRADWDDLNLPARMSTLALAGLPMLQRANPGHLVAAENLGRASGTAVFFDDLQGAARSLRDRQALDAVRERVVDVRQTFTFDAHADRLIDFFRMTIDRAARSRRASGGRTFVHVRPARKVVGPGTPAEKDRERGGRPGAAGPVVLGQDFERGPAPSPRRHSARG
ncbi:MAG: glycosyltransferase [Chloroflexota bacterium]